MDLLILPEYFSELKVLLCVCMHTHTHTYIHIYTHLGFLSQAVKLKSLTLI